MDGTQEQKMKGIRKAARSLGLRSTCIAHLHVLSRCYMLNKSGRMETNICKGSARAEESLVKKH